MISVALDPTTRMELTAVPDLAVARKHHAIDGRHDRRVAQILFRLRTPPPAAVRAPPAPWRWRPAPTPRLAFGGFLLLHRHLVILLGIVARVLRDQPAP